MGKNLKKYVRFSIICTIIKHAIVMLLFSVFGLFTIGNNNLITEYTIIFFSIVLIIFFKLIYLLIKQIYFIKNLKSKDLERIEHELENPILIVKTDYILTDTFIINLKKIHIFKYKDIDYMYSKCGLIIASNKIRIVKYICTKTNDGMKDKFLIGYPFIIDCSPFYDFSDIIIKKNPFVKIK